jgi:hypothetical protein
LGRPRGRFVVVVVAAAAVLGTKAAGTKVAVLVVGMMKVKAATVAAVTALTPFEVDGERVRHSCVRACVCAFVCLFAKCEKDANKNGEVDE